MDRRDFEDSPDVGATGSHVQYEVELPTATTPSHMRADCHSPRDTRDTPPDEAGDRVESPLHRPRRAEDRRTGRARQNIPRTSLPARPGREGVRGVTVLPPLGVWSCDGSFDACAAELPGGKMCAELTARV